MFEKQVQIQPFFRNNFSVSVYTPLSASVSSCFSLSVSVCLCQSLSVANRSCQSLYVSVGILQFLLEYVLKPVLYDVRVQYVSQTEGR